MTKVANTKKILIEMKHGLGDCVAMIPAIENIRYNYPDAYIVLIVNGEANKEIFEHTHCHVDEYCFLSLKYRKKIDTARTLWKLWRMHFDVGLLSIVTPPRKGKWLFSLLGVKEKLGEPYRDVDPVRLEKTHHFVERNLENIKPICRELRYALPRLYVDHQETSRIKQVFHLHGRYIVLNIGGADKNYFKGTFVFTRNWKREYMIRLADLLAGLDAQVCLLGGALEAELLPDFRNVLARENVVDCINKTSIHESIALINGAEISIGVDTGMQHIADALGIATVSIFGPTDPRTHGAYSEKASFVQSPEKLDCQYCFGEDRYYTCPDRKCMNLIMPEMVYQRVVDKLAGTMDDDPGAGRTVI